MALDSTVRARVDGELKEEVEAILSEIGLSTSQAITLFLKRIKYEKGIPFELKVPNATTLQAMEEAKNNDGETVNLNEFLKESETYAKTL
ncbi:MAG: DNA-damage-inducible protein J [uncultured Sulfurovum sp.]|uniref:DNA-damage-inducible protein J n=1 Tax=uncultured Sulfurovum sp. TaxID=269237 RepID=A0A6S6S629_9BACT|nr:MAG: DNA-damage-inducible protein J [uncultured Sulfurovum sp.]